MARKKHNIHYIYKTTCIITSRWYVGMHSTSTLDDGYMGSGTILRRSIRKHGKENHVKEILEFCESREELITREKEIVSKELISDGLCINLKEGGCGGFSSEEHQLKCSHAGHVSYKNKLDNDIEFSNKISKRASHVMRQNHEDGKIKYNMFAGKHHSQETKKLMSEKAKEYTGEKNSQFGTCWITKDGLNKKIKKEDLDKWIIEGWIKGRIKY